VSPRRHDRDGPLVLTSPEVWGGVEAAQARRAMLTRSGTGVISDKSSAGRSGRSIELHLTVKNSPLPPTRKA
jgi:hypothetical protein